MNDLKFALKNVKRSGLKCQHNVVYLEMSEGKEGIFTFHVLTYLFSCCSSLERSIQSAILEKAQFLLLTFNYKNQTTLKI